jgi:hypothetical protein
MLDGTCPTPEARPVVPKRGVAVTGSSGHLDLLVARAQYCAPYEQAPPRVIGRVETTLQAGTTLSEQPADPSSARPARSFVSQRSASGDGVQTGAGRKHRSWPTVDGIDDLRAVYALEVNAGDPEVAMPELPLDDDQRNAFVRHLDSVRMPHLMWREPACTPALTAIRLSCLRAAEAS